MLAVGIFSFLLACIHGGVTLAGAEDPEQMISVNDVFLCQPQYPDMIFYNRVPKAGSTSMLEMIERQQSGHKLTWVHSREFSDRGWHTAEEEKALVDQISEAVKENSPSVSLPVIYDQHIRYLNFKTHGSDLEPKWINIIRDPISREVSSYYYTIYGPRKKSKIKRIKDKRGDQAGFSINQCLELPPEERQCGMGGPDRNLMTGFFCGHHPDCKCIRRGKNSMKPEECTREKMERALAIAKKNLQSEYVVVGLLERMEDTMTLLEKLMPVPFNGITKKKAPHDRKTQGDKRYVQPSDKIREKMKEMLWMDYELYEFAKKLFEVKLKGCGIAETA